VQTSSTPGRKANPGSDLFLFQTQFKPASFEVLTNGLRMHLRAAFQVPPMAGNVGSESIDDDRVARKVRGQASLAKATLPK